MTVYVIETGEYSDRRVVCVCDDPTLADELSGKLHGTVTPWVLNDVADRLRQGYRLWAVSFWAATLDLREAILWWTPEDLVSEHIMSDSWWDGPDGYQKGRRASTIDVRVVALNEKQAIKIALDRARAFKAGQLVSAP